MANAISNFVIEDHILDWYSCQIIFSSWNKDIIIIIIIIMQNSFQVQFLNFFDDCYLDIWCL